MTLLGLVLSLLFVPSVQEKSRDSDKPLKLCTVISMFNPMRIFRRFVYPNVFLAVSIICQYHIGTSRVPPELIEGLTNKQ